MWSHRFSPVRFEFIEIVVVFIVLFILFGHRLPSVMRSLARSVVRPWDPPETNRARFEVLMAGIFSLVICGIIGLLFVAYLASR